MNRNLVTHRGVELVSRCRRANAPSAGPSSAGLTDDGTLIQVITDRDLAIICSAHRSTKLSGRLDRHAAQAARSPERIAAPAVCRAIRAGHRRGGGVMLKDKIDVAVVEGGRLVGIIAETGIVAPDLPRRRGLLMVADVVVSLAQWMPAAGRR